MTTKKKPTPPTQQNLESLPVTRRGFVAYTAGATLTASLPMLAAENEPAEDEDTLPIYTHRLAIQLP